MRWEWDGRRYRNLDTGRYVSSAQVLDIVDQIVDKTNLYATDTLVQMLDDGRLNSADWYRAMAGIIKDAYIQQAILAAGGRERVTQADWGGVGGSLVFQYDRLRNFTSQLDTLTIGQIRMRARMYVNSSRRAFWNVKGRRAFDAGLTEEQWITMGDDTVCDPCVDAGMLGWMSLGFFGDPGSGTVILNPQTTCAGLVLCRCRKKFR